MSKRKYIKAGLLVVILAGPALLFLTWRFTGHNVFQLPFYGPRLGVVESTGDTIYYSIPDSTILNLNWKEKSVRNKINIVLVFNGEDEFQRKTTLSATVKLLEVIGKYRDVQIVYVYNRDSVDLTTSIKEYDFSLDEILLWELPRNISLSTTANYFFVENIKDSHFFAVLLDKGMYIRGYYDLSDKGKIDLLIRELGVLNQEYE